MSTELVSKIVEHMEVYGSDGTKLGVVDHVLGDEIKLTKNDSPDHIHHLIPTALVDRVDAHVHLSKASNEVKLTWKSA